MQQVVGLEEAHPGALRAQGTAATLSAPLQQLAPHGQVGKTRVTELDITRISQLLTNGQAPD